MYYVIPDIHGCNDLLQKALNYIYKKEPNGGKIIFLGDYIDRGRQNVDVLLTVMNPPENWEFITLMGNHEQMVKWAYRREANYYDPKFYMEVFSDTRITMDQIYDWILTLPIVHLEGNNIFAHAFYDPYTEPENQIEQHVLWQRYGDGEPFGGDTGLYLTHGHTPRQNGPLTAPNRCNLDCGAPFYGQLVIGEYDHDTKGPINFVRFENA